MVDELAANFDVLLRQYPSGMNVNSLLAAMNFNVHQKNIVVGNGAAELIKSLIEGSSGKLGIVRPTFEEYSHRYDPGKLVVFWPDNDDYSYSVQDLITFFEDKGISTLVLINPDNPSGNHIKKADVYRLIDWTAERGIKLIVDESFADFADEPDNSFFDQLLLDTNPHLYVIKSISKSFGVPGLRLGVLASGNTEMIAYMKKDVAIWNINSFAEFYLQIAQKYKNDYSCALELFREERARFIEALSTIRGLRVIPSQANFVMAELTTSMSASDRTRLLSAKSNRLIKNLQSNIKKENKQ
jgi:histidinol-phosphate/aromatic aminotransferase/cobyric acid decarboxylase-like protein